MASVVAKLDTNVVTGKLAAGTIYTVLFYNGERTSAAAPIVNESQHRYDS